MRWLTHPLEQTSAPAPPATLIKICGLKTPEAALVATEAGADFLGLVFAEKSKRHVSISAAKEIITAVRSRPSSSSSARTPLSSDPSDWFAFQSSRLASHPRKPLFVGVFQNPSLETLLNTVEELGLDIVQLHGDEPLEWARLLPVPVVKAFHVDAQFETGKHTDSSFKDATRPGYHSVPLLDTKVSSAKGALSGGAGKVFDWSVAARLVESRGEGQGRLPIFLAGGVDKENVASGIEQVRPWAVDVSGGVETNGEKDLDKIRELIKLVKSL